MEAEARKKKRKRIKRKKRREENVERSKVRTKKSLKGCYSSDLPSSDSGSIT